MKGHVYKTILFSLMVCNIKVAGQGCAQGEPKIGKKSCKLSPFVYCLFNFTKRYMNYILIRLCYFILFSGH